MLMSSTVIWRRRRNFRLAQGPASALLLLFDIHRIVQIWKNVKPCSPSVRMSQETRLRIVRLLVQRRARRHGGRQHRRRRSGVSASNVSFHLKELERGGLATARRESRSIVYTAGYDTLRDLLRFLMEDCCAWKPRDLRAQRLQDKALQVAGGGRAMTKRRSEGRRCREPGAGCRQRRKAARRVGGRAPAGRRSRRRRANLLPRAGRRRDARLRRLRGLRRERADPLAGSPFRKPASAASARQMAEQIFDDARKEGAPAGLPVLTVQSAGGFLAQLRLARPLHTGPGAGRDVLATPARRQVLLPGDRPVLVVRDLRGEGQDMDVNAT